MKTFISIALIGSLLSLGCIDVPQQSQVSNNEVQTQKPVQLVRVNPQPNATSVTPDVTVSAKLEFLRGNSPILPASLRLLIDSVDVTEQSQVAATDDFPSSQGEISFKPSEAFSTGKHTAKVQFANNHNEQFSYSWDFYVNQK